MRALLPSGNDKRAVRRVGDAGKRVEYLAFGLAGETYAVPIVHVAEILRPQAITHVPRAPDTVLGVMSVRGRLVTVMDLRRQFHLPPAVVDRRTRILLADVGTGEQVGLLVDDVQQVWRLATDEIEPANVLGGEQAAYIAGIGRPPSAAAVMLILLDLRPLLEAS
jgi:purine-binding chemotaxis protein CheW